MKPDSNIICVVNESDVGEEVLESIIKYASSIHAHIHFVRIIDACRSANTLFYSPQTDIKAELHMQLSASILHKAPGISNTPFSCHILEGVWFIEIIQYAMSHRSKMIVITEPLSAPLNFSSNVMHIIRKSPIPVWLMRNDYHTNYANILVVVDIDINDMLIKNANAKCLMLANEIKACLRNKCSLSLVHCWSLPNEKTLRECTNKITLQHVNEMCKRQQHFHEEWFHAFCDKYAKMNFDHAYIIHAEAASEIPVLMIDEKISLLIMNTVDDVNTNGLFISSSAETILLSSQKCSSLTIKPDGFQSPISKKNRMIDTDSSGDLSTLTTPL